MTLNSFILTICTVSIVGMAFRSLVSKDSYKRIISMTVSLVAVLSAMSALPEAEADSFEFSVSPEETTDSGLDSRLSRRFGSEAERAVKEELESLLKEKGYSLKKLVITCSVNEYDTIVIDKAEAAAATEQDRAGAEAYLRELLPDTEITVVLEEAV